MPNSRRKKNSGSNTRVDSSSQKGFATIATVNIAENAEVEQVMLVNGTASDKPDALVDGCVAHNPILNGSMAASSQTESSDVESISSGSSRRNTMSSSGGDRDTTHSTCKNKVLEEPVRAMLQSCSVASHVDYGSDEGVLRTPEDAYPCCSSSEAMIGGTCEGYTPVSGAASQTELASGNGDGLLNVLSMSSWDRVETICELISFLNVYELRLLGACVEGAARPASSTPTMRQHESRSNCPQFISTMATNMGKISYALKVEAAYNVVCLLNSTNRQAAYALVRLIDHLMEIRDMELEVLSTNEARREVLINLGKLVSASIHHPAFSVDQRIRLVHVRDEIRNKLEQITERVNQPTLRSSASNSKSRLTSCSTSPLAGGFAFVRRFRATQPDLNDIDNFLVEMIWSDGERTFVGRTRNDINTLHHRLLDMFGEERREMKQAQDANIEQPESACSSRTASPTATDSNATPTPAVGTSALRILPYFSMDCSPAAVIQYINALSDLPARMMLSSVIYEQFFASRLSSDELEVAERSIPIASPSLQRYTHPASSPVIYPVASAALAYSSRGTGIQESSLERKDQVLTQENVTQIQVQFPSCSNCAGPHAFVQCPKDSHFQKDEGKLVLCKQSKKNTFSLSFGVSCFAQRSDWSSGTSRYNVLGIISVCRYFDSIQNYFISVCNILFTFHYFFKAEFVKCNHNYAEVFAKLSRSHRRIRDYPFWGLICYPLHHWHPCFAFQSASFFFKQFHNLNITAICASQIIPTDE